MQMLSLECGLIFFLCCGDVGAPGLKLHPETLDVIHGGFHLYSNPSLSVVFSSICSLSILIEVNSPLFLPLHLDKRINSLVSPLL